MVVNIEGMFGTKEDGEREEERERWLKYTKIWYIPVIFPSLLSSPPIHLHPNIGRMCLNGYSQKIIQIHQRKIKVKKCFLASYKSSKEVMGHCLVYNPKLVRQDCGMGQTTFERLKP